MHRIILAKEKTKNIFLSYDGKAFRLRMRTASLKNFPLEKNENQIPGGAWGMGYPNYLSKEGVSEHQ